MKIVVQAVLYLAFLSLGSTSDSPSDILMNAITSNSSLTLDNLNYFLSRAAIDVGRLTVDTTKNESLKHRTQIELSKLDRRTIKTFLAKNNTKAVVNAVQELISKSDLLQGYQTTIVITAEVVNILPFLRMMGLDIEKLKNDSEANATQAKKLEEVLHTDRTKLIEALKRNDTETAMALVRKVIDNSPFLLSYMPPDYGSRSATITFIPSIVFIVFIWNVFQFTLEPII